MPPPTDEKVQCIAVMASIIAAQTDHSQSFDPSDFVRSAIQIYNEVIKQLAP